MILKSDLHMHTNCDIRHPYNCNVKDIIDYRTNQGFNVLGITLHNILFFDKDVFNCAARNNIFLIPGIELDVINDFHNRTLHHVLLYNCDDLLYFYRDLFYKDKDGFHLKRYIYLSELIDYLEYFKHNTSKNFLVVAHPFYVSPTKFASVYVLLKKLKPYLGALEYCHFYNGLFNKHNKTMLKYARKKNIPVIASSDIHIPVQLKNIVNYSLVDLANFDEGNFKTLLLKADFTEYFTDKSVDLFLHYYFESIKNNNLKIVTTGLNLRTYFIILWYVIKTKFSESVKKKIN